MCDKKKVAKHVKHDARSFFFISLNSRPSTSTSLFHFVFCIFFWFFLPLGCYRVKFFFYYFVVLGEWLISCHNENLFLFLFHFDSIVFRFVLFFLVFITAQVCYRNPVSVYLKGGNNNRAGQFFFFFFEGNQSCAFACFLFFFCFFIVGISNEFSWAFIDIQFYVRISLRLL